MLISKKTPTLCLDLDWTVRKPISNGKFIQGPDDIELIEGIEEAIWRYKDKGFLVMGFSNQGGVAFGFKNDQDIREELHKTLGLFKKNPFTIVKHCYHHEDGNTPPYNVRSLLRKPSIGMLALAEVELFNEGYVVDWDNSLFVGDMESDKQTAENAAMKFMWAKDFLNPHAIELVIQ